jgi:hypothetical protein
VEWSLDLYIRGKSPDIGSAAPRFGLVAELADAQG